jgi:hypothetical protein
MFQAIRDDLESQITVITFGMYDDDDDDDDDDITTITTT